jgi:hypothetical protein
MKDMKRILNFAMMLATAVLFLAGCKEKDEVMHRIVGEWSYADEESGNELDIRVAFNVDKTFDLYQKVGEGAHRYYKGTYTVNLTRVNGVYSDGTPWASEYDVTFMNGDMIMQSTSSEGYSITYKKERIPDEVRNHYVDMTKSAAEDFVPFL